LSTQIAKDMNSKTLNASRLSVKNIEMASRVIDPVFRWTPQFESQSLSSALGMELVLKVETVNPIRSFKGRGADYFASLLSPRTRSLVCGSAGNFGQALAYAASRRGVRIVVFAAENANPLKIERMRSLGAEVRLYGADFDAAKRKARLYAEETGATFVEDGREPAISEGAGTIALELCQLPSSLDFVLVPLGNGALLAGIGLWMKAYSPPTRVIGVCASGAPAMAISLETGKAHSSFAACTIADGIAVRVPIPEVLDDLSSVVDEVLLVEDRALVEAMQLAHRHHGLVVEPAGAAALAAAVTYKGRFRGGRVAVPLCGGNLTERQAQEWLFGRTP
jgi:threonine dehydratase